jgi:hypothetical protein
VGEAVSSEGVNQKGRRIFHEDATDARAGWARGRVGRKVGRAEIKKKNSELKIGFLNLPRF